MVKLTDRVDENTQSIGELWESVEQFAYNRVADNRLYDDNKYPIEVRIAQMATLRVLVKAIDEFHAKFSEMG